REPIERYLLSRGHVPRRQDILLLDRNPATIPIAAAEIDGLKIIPTRASFRHARQLFAEAAAEAGKTKQLADANLVHLEDPHWDSLLALQSGSAVAHAGVLAVGELGMIEDLYVSPALRRHGLGRTMMARVLEICARSLFRQVMLSVGPENAP